MLCDMVRTKGVLPRTSVTAERLFAAFSHHRNSVDFFLPSRMLSLQHGSVEILIKAGSSRLDCGRIMFSSRRGFLRFPEPPP